MILPTQDSYSPQQVLQMEQQQQQKQHQQQQQQQQQHQQKQQNQQQQQHQQPAKTSDDDDILGGRSLCPCLPCDGSMSSIGSSTGVDTFFSTRDLRPLCFNDKHFPDLLGSDDESGVEVQLSLRPGARRGASSGNLVSLEDRAPSEGQACSRVKLMCSFGGRIIPRPSDGKLRYVGGETRIATVNRDMQFGELMARMCELCDQSVLVKYQMPEEDLDALVSVCNAEDLENMMEEYDRLEMGDGSSRLRVFLFPSASDYELDFLDPSVDTRDPDQQYIDAVNGTLDLSSFRKDSGAGDSVSGSASNSNCNDLIGLEASYQGDSADLSSLMNASASTLAASTPVSPRIFPWQVAKQIDLAGQATVNFYHRVAFEAGGQINSATGRCQPELQHVLEQPETTCEGSSPLKGTGDCSLGDQHLQGDRRLDDMKRPPVDFGRLQQDVAHLPPAFIPNGQQHLVENMGAMFHRSPSFHGVVCHGMPPGSGYHILPAPSPPCMAVQGRSICVPPQLQVHIASGRHHQRQHCGGFQATPAPPCCCDHMSDRRPLWWHQYQPCSHCGLMLESQLLNKVPPLLSAESASSSKVLQNGPSHRLEQGFALQTESGIGHYQEPQSGLTLTSVKDAYPDSRHAESSASSSRYSAQQYGTSAGASISDSVLGHLSGGTEPDNAQHQSSQRSQEVESSIDAKIQQCARLLEDSLQEQKTGNLSNLMDDLKIAVPHVAAPTIPSSNTVSDQASDTVSATDQASVTNIAVSATDQVSVTKTLLSATDAKSDFPRQALEETVTEVKEQVRQEEVRGVESDVISRRLQKIKNSDIEEIRQLGSGTFGTVFYGKWRNSDVAIKRIKPSCFSLRPSERDRLIADFWREADTLANLSHPNVVAFYGVVHDGPDGTLATVTEYMVNGSLKHVLQKKDRTIDRRKRLQLAMDAACGMEYLHEKKIVHFDLKSENLLVNMRDPQHPICKVGDFGLSKVKRQTMVSGGVRGTLPWMAPELLSSPNNMVTEKVDVFSFGIVMWELLTGEEPYHNMHHGEIIGGIVKNTLRPEIPLWCEPLWRSLMERCWSADPSDRPSFSEVARELRAMSAQLQQQNNPAQQAPSAQ